MPRQDQYISPNYLNVEPIYVAPSGGDVRAAVQRSELDFEVAKLDEQLSSTLRLADVRKLSKWINLDDEEGDCERKTYVNNVSGVDYTYTIFECFVDGWATKEFWEAALFQGDEQVFVAHKFVVTAPGVMNVTFQGKEIVPNGAFKILVQRTPEPPPVPVLPVPNNLN